MLSTSTLASIQAAWRFTGIAAHAADSSVQQIYARIENIARGAALMSETQVSCRFDKACSGYLPNRTL